MPLGILYSKKKPLLCRHGEHDTARRLFLRTERGEFWLYVRLQLQCVHNVLTRHVELQAPLDEVLNLRRYKAAPPILNTRWRRCTVFSTFAAVLQATQLRK
jgi:predicted nucleic acid-binding protein